MIGAECVTLTPCWQTGSGRGVERGEKTSSGAALGLAGGGTLLLSYQAPMEVAGCGLPAACSPGGVLLLAAEASSLLRLVLQPTPPTPQPIDLGEAEDQPVAALAAQEHAEVFAVAVGR